VDPGAYLLQLTFEGNRTATFVVGIGTSGSYEVPPGPFTLSVVVDASGKAATLSWTSSSPSTTYVVKRSRTANGPFLPITGEIEGLSSAVGATDSNSFYCVVSARNGRSEVHSNVVKVDFSRTRQSITALAAGQFHSLAVWDKKALWAWGSNSNGQLGSGTMDKAPSDGGGVVDRSADAMKPVQVDGFPPNDTLIEGVAAGLSFSVALTQSSDSKSPTTTGWAWGANASGQLGNGTWSDSPRPIKITGLTGITKIVAGWHHVLALKIDQKLKKGTIFVWGNNSRGQLGIGSRENQNHFVELKDLPDFKDIAAGGFHSLACTSDGKIYAWGLNDSGQLGTGDTLDRDTPQEIHWKFDGQHPSHVAAGALHSLAWNDDPGRVFAWGSNDHGQLGGQPPEPSKGTPTRPGPVTCIPSGASLVVAGGYHTLALTVTAGDSRILQGWGFNAFGQLGVKTRDDRLIPLEVPLSLFPKGLENSLAAGAFHTLAAPDLTSLKSWGSNAFGQLGAGPIDPETAKVTGVPYPQPVDFKDP
jgi:alpha-tubulin suppressor-like RCC1 family protein